MSYYDCIAKYIHVCAFIVPSKGLRENIKVLEDKQKDSSHPQVSMPCAISFSPLYRMTNDFPHEGST